LFGYLMAAVSYVGAEQALCSVFHGNSTEYRLHARCSSIAITNAACSSLCVEAPAQDPPVPDGLLRLPLVRLLLTDQHPDPDEDLDSTCMRSRLEPVPERGPGTRTRTGKFKVDLKKASCSAVHQRHLDSDSDRCQPALAKVRYSQSLSQRRLRLGFGYSGPWLSWTLAIEDCNRRIRSRTRTRTQTGT